MESRVVAAVLSLCLIGVTAAAPAASGSGGRMDDDEVAFKISDPRITESSGLAASRRHPGIVYTHNDSSDTPRIFAIGPDGRTRATYTITGAQARDWEGMALGSDENGEPALYVGDIGDNMDGAWPYITVYRVREPKRLRDRTLPATPFRLKYEDGGRDAESIFINPRTNQLYVASKKFSGEIFAAPRKLRTGRMNKLREVGDGPLFATDGSYSPDGRSFAIRTYFRSAHLYTAPGKDLTTVSIPRQKQGESITYAADGRSLLVGSEGVNQPVYRVPLPEEALPKPASGKSSGETAAKEEEKGGSKGILMLGLIALGVGGYFVYRRRRASV